MGKGQGQGEGKGQRQGKGRVQSKGEAKDEGLGMGPGSVASSFASSPALVAIPGKRGSISPGLQTTERGGPAYKKLKVGAFFRQSMLGFAPAVERRIGEPDTDEEIDLEKQMDAEAAEHGRGWEST